MVLKVGELRKLGEDLKLKLPPKMKEKALRRAISTFIKSLSKEQSDAATASKDKPIAWSPPKDNCNPCPLIIHEFPENGVRIREMTRTSLERRDGSDIKHNNSRKKPQNLHNLNKHSRNDSSSQNWITRESERNLIEEIKNLNAEVKDLKSNLYKSESLRKKLTIRVKVLQDKINKSL